MAGLVIFGNRTAVEVAEAAELGCKHLFDTILVRFFAEPEFSQSLAPELESQLGAVHYLAGVADVMAKLRIISACSARGWQPATVIHPSAVVASSAHIGDGVFIGPLAVISSHAQVAEHAIVHLHASIGHDAHVGAYSAVLPGARVSGNVRIGKRALIGSNAFLNAGISIGEDSQVDALTYVSRHLPPGMLVSTRSPRPVPRVNLSGVTE
ncbi:UDP-N-acetylbacillosamine N-acetyltransferase [Pirellula sp. SH-Sr6A]|uniref:DapH/DapD/GlmU-related protein n=1 Tax=Pirellula sp. SH-Sr6A TaxID=1632865 RepID=UPI00078C1D9E|nr:DapH/DapD/GlmU-related protein [Pirellula sp. SH-Sr6A]AMV31853.1 UDP-N-acetylbacillosamine N-acetyltransferase [Pirellula sp. SH-Sr6A]